jgi:hypothetical protein
MAKAAPDAMIDSSLAYVAASNIMHVCSAQPANYAGIAAVSLADIAVTPGDGNGDFTIANGDTNGRKLTTGAQSGVTVDSSGDASHIVWALSSDTTLRYVTTCTTQTLTSGNTVSWGAIDIEIADPT